MPPPAWRKAQGEVSGHVEEAPRTFCILGLYCKLLMRRLDARQLLMVETAPAGPSKQPKPQTATQAFWPRLPWEPRPQGPRTESSLMRWVP